jgi:hypothetical protein
MIALGLALLAISRASVPAPTIEPYLAREVIKPLVTHIVSCREVDSHEVKCLVVRRRQHETAHAVRYRQEPSESTKGIRVSFTLGWGTAT